jgi:two-component system NtrC family sensor kinase
MVVEDEPITALDIRKQLKSLGYEVPGFAALGEEVLIKIATTRPDLVLMDISLKGQIDGVAAAEQIRTAFNIPVIFLTAYSDEATLRRAKVTEPSGYILKPFDPDALRTTIELALYRHRTEQKLAAIYRLGQELTLLHDEKIIIERVLTTALDTLHVEWAGGGVIDERANELIYYHHVAGDSPREIKLCLPLDDERQVGVAVIRSGQAINITDIRRGSPYIPWAMGWAGRSEICVPMRVRQRIIGILGVASSQTRHFTLADQQLLQTLADQAAVVLENARLYRDAEQRTRELSMLNKTAHILTSSLDLPTVLDHILVEIWALLKVEGAAVLLYNPASDELTFAAAANPADEPLIGIKMPAKEGIAGWVVREKESIVVTDAQQDPRFYDQIDAQSGLTTRSLLAVPMLNNERVIGVIECINQTDGGFSQRDLETLETLAGSAAIAIENANLYRKEREQFERLQQSQAQLVQMEKMAALGRLVASIAHEINNPIQALQNALTLVKEGITKQYGPEKLNRYLDITEGEVQRIAAIVRRMRDFYHLAHQRQQLNQDSVHDFYSLAGDELQTVNLHTLVENILQLANRQLQQQGIKVECILADKLPSIQGSPDRLKQVFLNLVLNAMDAMADQGGKLIIHLWQDEAEWPGESPRPVVKIEFSDTGQGIHPDCLPRLFEPFFTTKEWGSGFGLFTSYKIIEAHHGQISVESRPGSGTTFTLTLPLTLTT